MGRSQMECDQGNSILLGNEMTLLSCITTTCINESIFILLLSFLKSHAHTGGAHLWWPTV